MKNFKFCKVSQSTKISELSSDEIVDGWNSWEPKYRVPF